MSSSQANGKTAAYALKFAYDAESTGRVRLRPGAP